MIASNPNMMYPSRHQLENVYDEGSSPHLFDYICIHGYQLFVKRTKKVYSVIARGWQPVKYVDEIKYSNGYVDYICYIGFDVFKTMEHFQIRALELLYSPRAVYMGKNPLIDEELGKNGLSLPEILKK